MSEQPQPALSEADLDRVWANLLALRSLMAQLLCDMANIHCLSGGERRPYLVAAHLGVIGRIEGAEFANTTPERAARVLSEATFIASRMFAGVDPPEGADAPKPDQRSE